MKIRFGARAAERGAIAVLVSTPDRWQGAAAALDAASGGQLTRAARVCGFQATEGTVCDVLAPSGIDATRVLLVGTNGSSSAAGQGIQRWERIGGLLSAHLLKCGERAVLVDADGLIDSDDDAAACAHLALGVRLRAYQFDKYRTASATALSQVTLSTSRPSAARKIFDRLDAVAAGVFLARDLVSEPPNILYPKAFADRARELSDHGVRVHVLGERKLRQLGFGALLGVSQGSAFEPQVLICEYDGTRGKKKSPPVVLAGKGVTFDAGGISIKPSAGLETLKQDMGGAASVVGAMKALALRRARCRVVGICGLVENMPSGTAQRPGDVVKSLSGKTVEIINTDAEGRLVLCDLLWYAQERYQPKVLIDMATLTGAIAIALGEDYAGLFCNDDELAARLTAAGEATGDSLWRYPMGESYDRQLDSIIADMKNLGSDKGRSIVAAQFIKRFVQPGVAWAHIDFGMRVCGERDSALAPLGATGFGVRLLDRLIADHFEER